MSTPIPHPAVEAAVSVPDQTPRQIHPEPGVEAATFDISGPLPRGTTMLEASAGTGKTWTIAALVTRYVAEGVPLDAQLVVTFGRAASQELRERVRDRLTSTERFLSDPVARREPKGRLQKALVADASDDELDLRHRRVRDALGAFDNATIATIHQFCQLVLRSLGVAGDADPGATLVEDLDDLRREVVDDVYLRTFADHLTPPFDYATAKEIAAEVVTDSAAMITPTHPADGSVAAARVAFARHVRSELAHRKRQLGVLGYDDLLADLARALEPEQSPARIRMRERWRVVLVDEFQDTDPVQWQVFERAFHGHSTMILIGDPKQAIYAFRGGDVETYLHARAKADHHATLAENRRSDGPLVETITATLQGTALGHPDIVVRRVDAARAGSRLTGVPVPAPWRLRVAARESFAGRAGELPRVARTRPAIAVDVAADIKRLLLSGAQFDGRALAPNDVSVLCSTGNQLMLVRDALHAHQVPAVLGADESVFHSPAALEWLALLEAMETPNRSTRVRAAALTSFFGHSPVDLDAQGERLTETLAERLRRWAELFALRGIPAVLEAANAGGLPGRVLASVGGERELTDLRHIVESLHGEARRRQLGLIALVAWLREQIADSRLRGSTPRSRRLASDAAAVQLSTIHGSKGLQFPIVYAPFLADRHVPDAPKYPRYHRDGIRCLDVSGAPHPQVIEQARIEDDGESLRLLYVAITRAQSQLVTWWAPTTTTRGAPLHRVLFGRDPRSVGSPEAEAPIPRTHNDAGIRLKQVWFPAGGPAPEQMEPIEVPDGPLVTMAERPLAVRSFTRGIDTQWRRTSYSALTRAADEAGLTASGFEPESPVKDDEAPAAEILPGLETAPSEPRLDLAGAIPSPMADLPVGATFGSLVHEVLEHADPAAPDLRTELLARIEESLIRWPVALATGDLATALVAVCTTPLGPLLGGTTLVDIGRRDRLCELGFEFPLAGGDRSISEPATGATPADRSSLMLRDLAPVLRAHLPHDDPVRSYADALDRPDLGGQALRGYLTGSIDLALRVDGRYVVVDYKTNWLGPPDAALTAGDYGPDALVAAMQHSSYPLQALLYAVVLHRFLRWRLPGYDPETHLGGVVYLYLRGMCGPETPIIDGNPTGVFSWRPPAALVIALSDLFDRRAA